MRLFMKIILVILVFLAISSGITKIMLMPQDLAFFAKYGFNNGMLILFGVIQLIGGGLMIPAKTRRAGVLAVMLTFAVSLVLLILDGQYGVSAITLLAMALLGLLLKQKRVAQA